MASGHRGPYGHAYQRPTPLHLFIRLESTHADLMKASPELMMPALITHNNLLQKAKWTNFGYTLEQEGDSYSIMFHEAADAVKFCLQVHRSVR